MIRLADHLEPLKNAQVTTHFKLRREKRRVENERLTDRYETGRYIKMYTEELMFSCFQESTNEWSVCTKVDELTKQILGLRSKDEDLSKGKERNSTKKILRGQKDIVNPLFCFCWVQFYHLVKTHGHKWKKDRRLSSVRDRNETNPV